VGDAQRTAVTDCRVKSLLPQEVRFLEFELPFDGCIREHETIDHIKCKARLLRLRNNVYYRTLRKKHFYDFQTPSVKVLEFPGMVLGIKPLPIICSFIYHKNEVRLNIVGKSVCTMTVCSVRALGNSEYMANRSNSM
jgi:hypothetical protein